MGIIKSYLIEGTDLTITESLYWSFEASRQDSVQTWKLLNYDKSSITREQLIRLVNYEENSDFEVEEKQGKKELIISTYMEQGEYRIICDEIISETRPYNTEELIDIILNYQSESSKDKELLKKYSELLDHLKSFVENEKIKRERILEQDSGTNSESVIKANAKLSLIKQIFNLLEEFELRLSNN